MYVASDGIHTAFISRDPEPLNPREDYDNAGTMVCWHRRRHFGDKHGYDDSQEFAMDLARSHLTAADVIAIYQSGTVKSLGTLTSEDLDCLSEDNYRVEEFFETCTTRQLIDLLDASNKVAILPLFLYDHSGVSMSTGSFVGRVPHAEWDSGQVGYIYMSKETALKELAMADEHIRIAMSFYGTPYFKEITFQRPADKSVDTVLKEQGFEPVLKEEHIKNLYDPKLQKGPANQPIIDYKDGQVFKKDRALYVFAGWNENGSFKMERVASFNPDLKRLTEENWKAHATKHLEAEVKTYDNYLTGEVYGIQCFEGLNEVYSCWGYNPGDAPFDETFFEDILDGWHPELASRFADYDEPFEIEDYFDSHTFPQLEKDIKKAVLDFLNFREGRTSPTFPFPYEMDTQSIRDNKNSVLDNVVDELYQEHKMPDVDRIHQALEEWAGVSREVQPRITAADLDPDRDYTEAEIVALVKKKGLDSMIAAAEAKKNTQITGKINDAPEKSR